MANCDYVNILINDEQFITSLTKNELNFSGKEYEITALNEVLSLEFLSQFNVTNLSTITAINFSHNAITNPMLLLAVTATPFQSCSEIYLSYNKILYTPLLSNPFCRVVDLSHNKLVGVPKLAINVQLEKFIVSHNLISVIDFIDLPDTIKVLDYSYNNINCGPQEFLKFCEHLGNQVSAIEKIYFKGNPFTNGLPIYWLYLIKSLRSLTVVDNYELQGSDWFDTTTGQMLMPNRVISEVDLVSGCLVGTFLVISLEQLEKRYLNATVSKGGNDYAEYQKELLASEKNLTYGTGNTISSFIFQYLVDIIEGSYKSLAQKVTLFYLSAKIWLNLTERERMAYYKNSSPEKEQLWIENCIELLELYIISDQQLSSSAQILTEMLSGMLYMLNTPERNTGKVVAQFIRKSQLYFDFNDKLVYDTLLQITHRLRSMGKADKHAFFSNLSCIITFLDIKRLSLEILLQECWNLLTDTFNLGALFCLKHLVLEKQSWIGCAPIDKYVINRFDALQKSHPYLKLADDLAENLPYMSYFELTDIYLEYILCMELLAMYISFTRDARTFLARTDQFIFFVRESYESLMKILNPFDQNENDDVLGTTLSTEAQVTKLKGNVDAKLNNNPFNMLYYEVCLTLACAMLHANTDIHENLMNTYNIDVICTMMLSNFALFNTSAIESAEQTIIQFLKQNPDDKKLHMQVASLLIASKSRESVLHRIFKDVTMIRALDPMLIYECWLNANPRLQYSIGVKEQTVPYMILARGIDILLYYLELDSLLFIPEDYIHDSKEIYEILVNHLLSIKLNKNNADLSYASFLKAFFSLVKLDLFRQYVTFKDLVNMISLIAEIGLHETYIRELAIFILRVNYELKHDIVNIEWSTFKSLWKATVQIVKSACKLIGDDANASLHHLGFFLRYLLYLPHRSFSDAALEELAVKDMIEILLLEQSNVTSGYITQIEHNIIFVRNPSLLLNQIAHFSAHSPIFLRILWFIISTLCCEDLVWTDAQSVHNISELLEFLQLHEVDQQAIWARYMRFPVFLQRTYLRGINYICSTDVLKLLIEHITLAHNTSFYKIAAELESYNSRNSHWFNVMKAYIETAEKKGLVREALQSLTALSTQIQTFSSAGALLDESKLGLQSYHTAIAISGGDSSLRTELRKYHLGGNFHLSLKHYTDESSNNAFSKIDRMSVSSVSLGLYLIFTLVLSNYSCRKRSIELKTFLSTPENLLFLLTLYRQTTGDTHTLTVLIDLIGLIIRVAENEVAVSADYIVSCDLIGRAICTIFDEFVVQLNRCYAYFFLPYAFEDEDYVNSKNIKLMQSLLSALKSLLNFVANLTQLIKYIRFSRYKKINNICAQISLKSTLQFQIANLIGTVFRIESMIHEGVSSSIKYANKELRGLLHDTCYFTVRSFDYLSLITELCSHEYLVENLLQLNAVMVQYGVTLRTSLTLQLQERSSIQKLVQKVEVDQSTKFRAPVRVISIQRVYDLSTPGSNSFYAILTTHRLHFIDNIERPNFDTLCEINFEDIDNLVLGVVLPGLLTIVHSTGRLHLVFQQEEIARSFADALLNSVLLSVDKSIFLLRDCFFAYALSFIFPKYSDAAYANIHFVWYESSVALLCMVDGSMNLYRVNLQNWCLPIKEVDAADFIWALTFDTKIDFVNLQTKLLKANIAVGRFKGADGEIVFNKIGADRRQAESNSSQKSALELMPDWIFGNESRNSPANSALIKFSNAKSKFAGESLELLNSYKIRSLYDTKFDSKRGLRVKQEYRIKKIIPPSNESEQPTFDRVSFFVEFIFLSDSDLQKWKCELIDTIQNVTDKDDWYRRKV